MPLSPRYRRGAIVARFSGRRTAQPDTTLGFMAVQPPPDNTSEDQVRFLHQLHRPVGRVERSATCRSDYMGLRYRNFKSETLKIIAVAVRGARSVLQIGRASCRERV